ncbi:hypothetical protein V8F44DRAFT_598975 [Aspergillus fumigatus]
MIHGMYSVNLSHISWPSAHSTPGIALGDSVSASRNSRRPNFGMNQRRHQSELGTANCELRTAQCKMQTANCKLSTGLSQPRDSSSSLFSNETRATEYLFRLIG